jgi:hypothetical protein
MLSEVRLAFQKLPAPTRTVNGRIYSGNRGKEMAYHKLELLEHAAVTSCDREFRTIDRNAAKPSAHQKAPEQACD